MTAQNPTPVPPTIPLDGTKVRQRREELQLTQLYVATAVGVTTDTISRWENRKYPSIKRENAQKLAEILEVDLEELVYHKPPPKEGSQTSQNNPDETSNISEDKYTKKDTPDCNTPPKPPRSKPVWWAAFVVVLVTLLLIVWKMSSPTKIYKLEVKRIVPPYAAPGTTVPIVIHITTKISKSFPMILRETLPAGCSLVKAIPPCTIGPNKRELDWIFQAQNNLTAAYLVKIGKKLKPGDKIRFSGTITIRGGQKHTIIVGGTKTITIKYVYWADLNGDGKIDDQELLTVFDELQGIKGLNYGKKKIEKLWSSGAYYWDSQKHEFLPKKQKTD